MKTEKYTLLSPKNGGCLLVIMFFLAQLMVAQAMNRPPKRQSGNYADARNEATQWLEKLRNASAKIVLADGTTASESVVLQRNWQGSRCQFILKNTSGKPVSVREVIVFDFSHGLPDTTAMYGEGFQKLEQVGGTLGKPLDLGTYTDRKHYKIPEPEGMRTAYGMMMLQLPAQSRILLATTSCAKFISRFSFDDRRLRISFDCENLTLAPGQTWQLEEFMATTSPSREQLYDQLTAAIARHHPRLRHDPVPAGWCSWYCFGPAVTAQNVSDNTAWIANNLPALRYIQIDDGYQPWMGDWLEQGKAFGGRIDNVLAEIKNKGLEPAIWVAPFIASPQSKLFQQHPDWFVQDSTGKPLRSDKVGFGGWRQGPWYALDGTHPAVQNYFIDLFTTLRKQWHCTYFKLDANYWGTIHGGVHYDKTATRIEAYRRGMEAVRKGAGDAFLLGCNHPIWPSLGMIHGSRSSMDTWRKWSSFRDIGRENLLRGWQNGRLWWNDPDCLLLLNEEAKDVMDQAGQKTRKELSDNEFGFHAATIYASGGMLLSGDDLTKMTPDRVRLIKKLLPPTGIAARFDTERFDVGVTHLKGYDVYSVFNWGDEPVTRQIVLPAGTFSLTDKFTDERIGKAEKGAVTLTLPAHSARVIEARLIKK